MQATVHANLGSWLEAQQEQHHVPILATPTAHPASVLFFGRAAVSFGALTVVLVVSCFPPYMFFLIRAFCGCRAESKQMHLFTAALVSSKLLCKSAAAKAAALQRHMSSASLLQG